MTTTQQSSTSDDQLRLIEVKPGKRFSVGNLRSMLPDVEMILFFAMVYKLDAKQLGNLLRELIQTDLVKALTDGRHSTELQDYIVADVLPDVKRGTTATFDPDVVPSGEVLPHLWQQLEVEVAASIAEVATKLDTVLDRLPGKQGAMIFQTMAKLNMKRPTIGTYQAGIAHPPVAENLVIFDVSGSMSRGTVEAIADDVVGLSYKANAHLAIVSNTTTHWEPGTFNTGNVVGSAEFGGTHYETLTALLKRDWGTVITIADYDSSLSAKEHIGRHTKGGRIKQLLDISLVDQPTFLAECVGQIADEVRPILIGNSSRVLR